MNTFTIIKLIGEAPSTLLNSTETAVLMRMVIFGNREGKNINPGIKEISRTTKICERVIKKTLSTLVKKEVIILNYLRRHGTNDKSCYEINIPLLQTIISQKVGAESAPRVGAYNAPTLTNTDQKVSADSAKVGADSAPRVGAESAPTPNTQLFKLDPLNNIVKLAPNSMPLSSTKKTKKNWGDETQEIFRHWQKILNHPKSKLDAKRRTKIVQRLADGYSVEDLKKAIEGVKKSSFHMGDNNHGKIYDGILVIFRNSEQVETFIGYFDSPVTHKNKNGATAQKRGFLEKSRDQLNALDKLDAELFPDHNFLSKQTKEGEDYDHL